MEKSCIRPRSLEDLSELILSHKPVFFVGSQTSTVIPYEKIQKALGETALVDLSLMPKKMEIVDDHLIVEGPVTWKDAKEFCSSKGFNILTSPTEELACMLSGIATSATGERCFGRGTLRSQLLWVEYMNHSGETKRLNSDQSILEMEEIKDLTSLIESYSSKYDFYKDFKNAPFPRFKSATDLLVGTEGQLGVITKAAFRVEKTFDQMFLFFSLTRWEENYAPHMEIFEHVQKFRGTVVSCELIDSNSLSVLDKDEKPVEGRDLLFLEMATSDMEDVYSKLISKLQKSSEEDIFEMNYKDCHQLRMSIPRKTFERNSQMGVIKKGTDIQVSPDKFKELLDIYRELAAVGVEYNLFGHFGDAHLHFNFMPTPDQVDICSDHLEKLYDKVRLMRGSPFAEHGIGTIKLGFISKFYEKEQDELFSELKKRFDPHNQFFPQGFMCRKKQ